MGFGKVGINLAERTVSWVKTVGKTRQTYKIIDGFCKNCGRF